jgi:hypothetical protein
LGDLCKRDEAILATIDAWDNGKNLIVVGGRVGLLMLMLMLI